MSVDPGRRAVLAGVVSGAVGGVSERDAWLTFRARFVTAEGRVVDTGNGGISHSEGQGWALMAALRADDRAAFEAIWRWTRAFLARPSDRLTAWKFRPGVGIEDGNSASDGDVFIAASLIGAGARWDDAAFSRQGVAVARDILRLVVRPVGALTVLLPGARGFEREGFVVVNPSYYAFAQLRVLARAVPDPRWMALIGDGLALLRAGRFGRWGLPPDWLAVPRVGPGAGGVLALPRAWPPRFSYDAIRVPLYLKWAGLSDEPACVAAAAFWSDPRHRHVPAWVDLATDAFSPYPAVGGVAAVARFTTRSEAPPGSLVAGASDYYAAALGLLVHWAWRDSQGLAG